MLGLAMSLGASLSAADTSVILAKIGTIQISSTEFMQRVKQLPAQYRNFYSSGEGKKLLLNQLVDEKLIFLAASREKYDQKKAVLEDVANAKSSIMASHYVRDQFQKVAITDADVQKYYDANQAQFQKPAKVHARHILVETEEEAKDVKLKLEGGADFEALAKEKSKDPSAKQNGGDLGFFAKGEMVPEFEKVAFGTELKKIADPIKTQFGWHVIQVLEVQEGSTQPLETVKNDVKDLLARDKQKQILDGITAAEKKKMKVEIYDANLAKF